MKREEPWTYRIHTHVHTQTQTTQSCYTLETFYILAPGSGNPFLSNLWPWLTPVRERSPGLVSDRALFQPQPSPTLLPT